MNPKGLRGDTDEETPTVQALFEEYKALTEKSAELLRVTDLEYIGLKNAGVLVEWSKMQHDVTQCAREARIALLGVDIDTAEKRLETLHRHLGRLRTLKDKAASPLAAAHNAHGG